jgi:peptide deformylase
MKIDGLPEKIITWPNPILSQKSEQVERFDDSLTDLIVRMYTTMKISDGVGISAIQIGVPKRVIIIEPRPNNYEVFINPTYSIINEELFELQEGCLSIPGYFEKRKRPQAISVRYRNINFKDTEVELWGVPAFIFLHEYEHIEGKLFIDSASRMKREFIKKKMKKVAKK